MRVLHHCSDARSFRPLWVLEEMGLPYELRMLPSDGNDRRFRTVAEPPAAMNVAR